MAKLLAYNFPRHSAPAVLLMLMSLVFSVLHLSAAHNVVRWARRRADLGLDGFGYPWEVRLTSVKGLGFRVSKPVC